MRVPKGWGYFAYSCRKLLPHPHAFGRRDERPCRCAGRGPHALRVIKGVQGALEARSSHAVHGVQRRVGKIREMLPSRRRSANDSGDGCRRRGCRQQADWCAIDTMLRGRPGLANYGGRQRSCSARRQRVAERATGCGESSVQHASRVGLRTRNDRRLHRESRRRPQAWRPLTQAKLLATAIISR